MALHTGISSGNVNSYHTNSSLLFQFILAEFIAAFAEIKKLEVLCSLQQNRLSPPEDNTRPLLDQEKVAASLTVLAGSAKDYMRIFSWNFSEGLLTKLKIYCSMLLQNGGESEKDYMATQHYAEKVWQGCLQALDAVRETPVERAAVATAVEKASTAMHRFAKQVARLVHQFKEDENVIFFIVRNHKVLDSLYGNRFTFKLLHKLYSKGHREAQQFLISKYTERRFHNVLTKIKSCIAEIEATAL
jgi:hypothetical protein